ncbi:NAD(P)/FAD-dependent oxidoreductase, partial [Candidatus Bathyarchaeota archaeon]|nr:NAD(P)/FAD-dependent oxidoreductase [Candidatus Bathyarchaeota archaeon]
MEVIVIGNGVGGMSVASKMRGLDGNVTIEIYSDEPYGYYSRVWLPQL